MTDELAEAKRHIRALFSLVRCEAPEPYRQQVRQQLDATAAFLSRLDAEGQTVSLQNLSVLEAMQEQFGPSPDGALERDIASAREGQTVEGGDLLPCPFCGAIPTDIEEYHGHYHAIPTFYVNCTACDVAIYGKGRDGAIARWNTRPAELTRLKTSQPEHDRTVRLAALEEVAAHFRKLAGLPDWNGDGAPESWNVAEMEVRALKDQTGGEGEI